MFHLPHPLLARTHQLVYNRIARPSSLDTFICAKQVLLLPLIRSLYDDPDNYHFFLPTVPELTSTACQPSGREDNADISSAPSSLHTSTAAGVVVAEDQRWFRSWLSLQITTLITNLTSTPADNAVPDPDPEPSVQVLSVCVDTMASVMAVLPENDHGGAIRAEVVEKGGLLAACVTLLAALGKQVPGYGCVSKEPREREGVCGEDQQVRGDCIRGTVRLLAHLLCGCPVAQASLYVCLLDVYATV